MKYTFMRLKGNTSETAFFDRLIHLPEVYEFHLEEADLEGQPYERLIQEILLVKRVAKTVVLHQPQKRQGLYQDIMDRSHWSQYLEHAKKLAFLAKQYDINVVIHANYAYTESSHHLTRERTKLLKTQIEKVLLVDGTERFFWENSGEGLFSYENPYLLEEVIQPLKLSLCHDISHTFLSYKGDNEQLQKTFHDIYEYTKYFHVVDSMGIQHDGLPIGLGLIDWIPLKSLIDQKPFIFEIMLKDYNSGIEMFESVNKWNSLLLSRSENQ